MLKIRLKKNNPNVFISMQPRLFGFKHVLMLKRSAGTDPPCSASHFGFSPRQTEDLSLVNPLLPLIVPADQDPSWSCEFVGDYHGLVPERCCFSADGSLLAVGFQEVVTVWSVASWELLTTLSQPPGGIRSETAPAPPLMLVRWILQPSDGFVRKDHVLTCFYFVGVSKHSLFWQILNNLKKKKVLPLCWSFLWKGCRFLLTRKEHERMRCARENIWYKTVDPHAKAELFN